MLILDIRWNKKFNHYVEIDVQNKYFFKTVIVHYKEFS